MITCGTMMPVSLQLLGGRVYPIISGWLYRHENGNYDKNAILRHFVFYIFSAILHLLTDLLFILSYTFIITNEVYDEIESPIS